MQIFRRLGWGVPNLEDIQDIDCQRDDVQEISKMNDELERRERELQRRMRLLGIQATPRGPLHG